MKKLLTLSLLTVGLITMVGVSAVSAHGWFWGQASPEETAEKQAEMFTQKAEVMGISEEALKNGWAQGKNMMEIAEEQGITQEELKAKMQELKKAKMQEYLQAMVDNGVITQEQADQRLQFMEEKGMMMRGGFKGGCRFGGMMQKPSQLE